MITAMQAFRLTALCGLKDALRAIEDIENKPCFNKVDKDVLLEAKLKLLRVYNRLSPP